VQSDILAPYISHLGNEAQKQQWLPLLAFGEAVGAIAMTEPGAGSDLQAMSVLSSTELQCKVADDCLQLFGGYGYMEEYPITRAFLDARVQRIHGGASKVMKEIIARDLLGK
jgi:alkylation response protein AidB-like acyl-CoA dehydrogenase